MSNYSKLNIVYRLQKWMDSVPGQTFLNYAYSWGAAIVILGTLFKLTHLPGANLMLFIGMGTEVFVFFISAFDRPFDKTADGRDIPVHLTPEYLEGLEDVGTVQAPAQPSVATPVRNPETVSAPVVTPTAVAPVTQSVAVNLELETAQSNYVDELKRLTEVLSKVGEQSSRLTRDSEEMENLNRTLTGIAKVYEMQLKSASQQIGTIDQINEQSRLMAQHIEQLNKIYTRMIEAMTVNMRAAAPGSVSGGQPL
uniref:Gliding motility protein GldL n=1 Tax=Prevotella sp. GTC17254 TaxID=3236794 RepID=A0AB33IVX1_9BACT